MNLTDNFYRMADRQPDHPAVIGPGKNNVHSYFDLREKIEFVAKRFETSGIGPNSCVGLHYPSGYEYIILTYALWRCGACVVPIAVELVPEEKHAVCHEICIDAIISKEDTAYIFEEFQNGDQLPLFENIIALPVKKFREHPDGFFSINPAFLRFTSGTTGTSKGVVLSHETIYDRIHAANEGLHIGPDDQIIWLMSMSYHFAVTIVSYLSFGATIVLCENHLGATVIQTVVENKGTIIYGSPIHYDFMIHDRSLIMMPSVRLIISTAASLPGETAEAFYKRFNIPLSESYGIIEVGLPCNNLDNPYEKRGSVGNVLPAYEIHMEDIGLGSDLKEIKLRGKGFLDAYYNPWRTRKEIMPDGWFATGDLGRLDEDGYLYITGRSKEMINVGGMKFFPQEVESVLESHPAVKEACVYAHQHKRLGDIPHANIVWTPSKESTPIISELRDYCKLHLASFKIPDKIHIVQELQRTASGKVIRHELKVSTGKGGSS